MKSAYYGIKFVSESYSRDDALRNTMSELINMAYQGYGKDSLEEINKITESINNDTCPLIKFGVRRKEKELILTQEDEERLNVGDCITLKGDNGKILYKVYDPVEKVMNYYTDITTSHEEDRGSIKKAKSFCLYKLRKAKEHIEEISDKVEERQQPQEEVSKGFWSRLFGR
jgi:hypothetical protein